MALTCPENLSGVDLGFTEFIDCSSLSINYDVLGVASVGFVVVASQPQPVDPQVYTDIVFGKVRFTGHIVGLEVRRLPGTIVYEHRYTITAVGCPV